MIHDKAEYWKKRIKEKLESSFRQAYFDIKEVEDYALHANLEMKDIRKAIIEVTKAYRRLDKALGEAEVSK